MNPLTPKLTGFPYEHFLNYFPQFAPTATKPNPTAEVIVACGNRAGMYLSDYESAWLNGERRIYAHCLLAAHVLALTLKAGKEEDSTGTGAGGEGAVGPVTSASVGGVSVSMQTPNSSNDGAFEWWLNKTPYGQEFLALVRTRAPMMAFIGSRTPVLPLR